MRRFPWLLTALAAAALTLLLALGTWQLQRLAWKTGLIAAAEAAADAPPAPLADVLTGPAPEFRRVIADCPGLAAAPTVSLQSIHEGEAGTRRIALCPVPGAAPILVDLGFVAADAPPPPASAPPEAAPLEGVLRDGGRPGPLTPAPANGVFYGRDVTAMAAALGHDGPVQPLTLFATRSVRPDWPALQPSAPPPAFSNNHLGYALTWYGLALVLAGFYIALVRRRLKDRP
jgi:surfeit locus 1 family protein